MSITSNSNQYKIVKLYVPILVPTSYDGKILENKKKNDIFRSTTRKT